LLIKDFKLTFTEDYYKKSIYFNKLTKEEQEVFKKCFETLFVLENYSQNYNNPKILEGIFNKQIQCYVSLLELVGNAINSVYTEITHLNPNLVKLYQIPYELTDFKFYK